MYAERKVLLKTFTRHKKELKVVLEMHESTDLKSSWLSQKSRKEGNTLYAKGKHNDEVHREIFTLYNASICTAPNDSQDLALAYGNRSAYLLHIGKLQASIIDIDRALTINTSDVLKVKLLCRKVECLKRLGLMQHYQVLKEAESCFQKLANEDRSSLEKLINRVKECKITSEDENGISETAEKMLADLSKQESWKVLRNVTVEYNDKYTRHLVANKNFQPGDVIFVENHFATVLFRENMHTNCQNCLKVCWSGIPCERCNWAMFCNKECKKLARENFHDMECATWSHPTMIEDEFMKEFLISFRALNVALKKVAYNVEDLKAQVYAADKDTDNIKRGFWNDGEFQSDTIQSLCTLSHEGTPEMVVKMFALRAIHVLFRLAKCTSLLGKNFKIVKVEDLMKNEAALFLGALLVRLMMIKPQNASSYDSIPWMCKKLKTKHEKYECNEEKNKCCQRGLYIAPFKNLINHSCNPNVGNCSTQDQRTIIYAIHPIKKGDQLFDTYTYEYYEQEKEVRKEHLNFFFRFTCDCLACTEDWPVFRTIDFKDKDLTEFQLLGHCEQVTQALEKGEISSFNKTSIKRLSESISKAVEILNEPSDVIVSLIQSLKVVIPCIYGLKPLTYGNCNVKS